MRTMSHQQLDNLIAEIPHESWEQNLPIGRFQRVEHLQSITRPFSYIARSRIVGDRDARVVFIKLYRNTRQRSHEKMIEKIRSDYEIARFWYDHFADSPQYRVVRPVLALPEQYLFASEESSGEDLYQLILKKAAFFPAVEDLQLLCGHLRRVGEWLHYKKKVMHQSGVRYRIEDLQAYMDVRLKLLSEDARRGFPLSLHKRVLDYLETRGGAVPENDLGVSISHSDFNPSNILVGSDTVTVLDFGRRVEEHDLLDLSKLHFQLTLLTLKPQYRTITIERLQQSLLEGFGDAPAGERLMFRMLTMRNILTHLTGISQFWKQGGKEKLYNRWVMRKELAMLEKLLEMGE